MKALPVPTQKYVQTVALQYPVYLSTLYSSQSDLNVSSVYIGLLKYI